MKKERILEIVGLVYECNEKAGTDLKVDITRGHLGIIDYNNKCKSVIEEITSNYFLHIDYEKYECVETSNLSKGIFEENSAKVINYLKEILKNA